MSVWVWKAAGKWIERQPCRRPEDEGGGLRALGSKLKGECRARPSTQSSWGHGSLSPERLSSLISGLEAIL